VFYFKGIGPSIARIHDDILKIWNFDDPLKLLSGEGFFKGMIRLVEPLFNEVIQVRNYLQAERWVALQRESMQLNFLEGPGLIVMTWRT